MKRLFIFTLFLFFSLIALLTTLAKGQENHNNQKLHSLNENLLQESTLNHTNESVKIRIIDTLPDGKSSKAMAELMVSFTTCLKKTHAGNYSIENQDGIMKIGKESGWMPPTYRSIAHWHKDLLPDNIDIGGIKLFLYRANSTSDANTLIQRWISESNNNVQTWYDYLDNASVYRTGFYWLNMWEPELVEINLNSAINDFKNLDSELFSIGIRDFGEESGVIGGFFGAGEQDEAKRPRLVITYTIPTPSITLSEASLSFGNININTISTKSYTLNASNLTANVNITAPSGFKISESQHSGYSNSLNIPHSNGSISNKTIWVRFSPTNTTTYSGNIIHTSTGANTRNIGVSGTGIGSLSVNITNLNFSPSADSEPVTVTSNVSWSVSVTSGSSWLSTSQSSGSGNGRFTISAVTNPTTNNRSGNVRVSGGGIARDISVTQFSQAETLTVSTNNVPIGAESGSSGSFIVTSNISWTAQSNQSWLTFNPQNGSNNRTVTVTASSANTSTSSRSARVTVSGSGIVREVTVTQQGTEVDSPNANFTANPTSGVVPLAVQFTDQSTNSPTSWSWKFGDGNTSTQQNPSHIYQNTGIYSVSLEVSNSGGEGTEVKTDYITVSEEEKTFNFVVETTTEQTEYRFRVNDAQNLIVDWGNGNRNTYNGDTTPTYDFGQAGLWTIKVKGQASRISFNVFGDECTYAEMLNDILTPISDGIMGITNAFRMFQNTKVTSFSCENFFDKTAGHVTDMRSMFARSVFNQDIGNWDMSNVTNMQAMFFISEFNQYIGSWDVSNVVNMQAMFYGSIFNQDIGNWDVSNVTDMQDMFYYSTFNQDISRWKVSKVISMHRMFSNSEFNHDIGDWDVSNVTDMQAMFFKSEFNQYIGNWDVSKVTDMQAMFANSVFNQDIGKWDVSNVIYMGSVKNIPMTRGMFQFSEFNQNIGNWDVSNVISMNGMFKGSEFNKDIGSWNVSNVKNMAQMFNGSFTFNDSLIWIYNPFNQDISSWDVGNVVFMTRMFGTSAFNKDIGSWDVSNVTDMSALFYNSMFNKDISNWDVSNVTNLQSMFSRSVFNQDIGKWNVSKVTDMQTMFANSVFNQDISNWQVSNVHNFESFLENTALSTTYYNNILINWSYLDLQEEIGFHGGNSQFDLGLPADRRQHIIDEFGWTIIDGGDTGQEEQYNLVLITDPYEGGTANGGGNFALGESVTVTATPNQGYSFISWSGDVNHIDNPDAPDAIVTMPASDITLTANFQKNAYSITLYAEPEKGGVVSGTGSYLEGETISISADANEDYEFVNWTGDTEHLANANSASFSFTMPAEDVTLIANFELTENEYVEVATLAELREKEAGETIYLYSGEAVLVAKDGFRNRKFIQDETAAILIYDQPGVITTEYRLYDVITGITGTISIHNNMVQFKPNENTAEALNNIPLSPPVLSIASLSSDDQAKLIKLENIVFVNVSGGSVFSSGASYTITDGVNEFVLRTDFYNVDYIGREVPQETLSLVGVIRQHFQTLQIVPRFSEDIIPKGHGSNLTLSPSSENYGSVALEECSTSKTFILKNEGGVNATGEVALSGGHSSHFIVVSGGGSFSLNANQTKIISVQFCPTTAGAFTANLNANGSDSTNSISTRLTGEGFEDDATIINEWMNINLLIYPNPTNSILNIELEKVHNEIAIKFNNIQGQTLTTVYLTDRGKVHTQIKVDGYNPGVYFLVIEGKGFNVRKKVIIHP